MPELVFENVVLHFGRLKALDEVSFSLTRSEILTIIGPNGAGKTSLLNCISGFYTPQQGNMLLNGLDLGRIPISKRAQHGIARTFQNTELFDGLTALDNILAARHAHFKASIMQSAAHYGFSRKEEIRNREIAEQIIDFLEIKAERKKVVGSLPYGIRKRVELGRALAIEPSLLLLDEPMSGMNVEEKEDMARFIIDIYEDKEIPIILIEHDMGVVMDISDRVVVLDFGKLIAEGPPEKIASNQKVINAYLGQ